MTLYEKLTTGTYFIAEMSANHAGSLENALTIVHKAKEAKADCLKIQTYTADTITVDCNDEPFLIKGGLWDGYKLYDLYKEAYTPWEWQPIIKEECEKIGLDFLSTPFDFSSVDFLEDMGVLFYKIASFELVDIPLIEYTASKGKPMIMSCGMASIEEIQDAVDACKRQNNDQVILLKCCSEYPAEYSHMNLKTITDMQKRYKIPMGLSDHSMGSTAAVVAVSLGATVIEKHICISRNIKNPDSEFSMEPHEYMQMVEDCRVAAEIRGDISYDLTEKEKASTIFRRSIFAVKDIKKGEAFTSDNIRSIRPANGISPKHYKELMEKQSKHNYKTGEPISNNEL
ncbi:MAG: pseudaminic acid synthase [Oscillospiraceae bacterium]|jgi:N-acetylneuraminate synthase/pseudaminic acid synthase|nr:pseudaminic acid synthase [Oscillospiraceae bacterium]